jgi:glycosyltransferase involved in cell wall biosynthesis
MRISIVVPSFNQARYLDAALRSLVEQEYSDKEIIVMDGGSTDGSVDVVRKYAPHLAAWRSGPDGGQARAIATGFDIATGQVLGWLNSDDVLAHGALERLARAIRLAGSPDGVFYGGFEVIDADGQVQEVFFGTRTVTWVARAIGPAICQAGTFFGRDAYLRVGGVDPSLQYAMDKDLWMRFVASDVRFIAIPEIQAQFRSHSLQKGHSLTSLKHCVDEELLIGRRYSMAPMGSMRRLVARQVQRVLRLTTGRLYKTVVFRILRRRRIRVFGVDYST